MLTMLQPRPHKFWGSLLLENVYETHHSLTRTVNSRSSDHATHTYDSATMKAEAQW